MYTRVKEMNSSMKNISVVLCFVVLAISLLGAAKGAGPCGRTSPDTKAIELAPCAQAARDENAAVSSDCCSRVTRLAKVPRCLCAVMLSNTAKSSGVKPGVAITIPKRCNMENRPIGYKCGAYSLP